MKESFPMQLYRRSKLCIPKILKSSGTPCKAIGILSAFSKSFLSLVKLIAATTKIIWQSKFSGDQRKDNRAKQDEYEKDIN